MNWLVNKTEVLSSSRFASCQLKLEEVELRVRYLYLIDLLNFRSLQGSAM